MCALYQVVSEIQVEGIGLEMEESTAEVSGQDQMEEYSTEGSKTDGEGQTSESTAEVPGREQIEERGTKETETLRTILLKR